MLPALPFPSPVLGVYHWAQRTPRAIAVVEGAEHYCYATLASHVARAAAMLHAKGARAGLLIGLQRESYYLQLVLILACEFIGAAHLSIGRDTTNERPDLVARCDLLCLREETPPWTDPARVVTISRDTLSGPPAPAVGADLASPHATAPDQLTRLATTSGTSGGRKFVGHSRGALQSMIAAAAYTLNDGAVHYDYVSAMGFQQWSTYASVMLALGHGRQVVFSRNRAEFLAAIRRLPRCHAMLLLSDALDTAAEAARGGGPVNSCRVRVTGAAAPSAIRHALRANLTSDLISSYAANETSYVAMTDDRETGTLLPDVSVRTVDEHGRPRQPGEVGIIEIRSPRLCDGYHGDAELTAKFFADGWFRTSDVGFSPEPGRLIVVGRTDDALNIGGNKIHPQPIENRAREVPGVRDVVLICDDGAVNQLHVFIEHDGDTPVDQISAVLGRLLRRFIPPPVSMTPHYTTSLPRGPTGKVQRYRLRDAIK